jgi:hypothetical protein
MAFGQQSGPPASARQVQRLTALVHAAGHLDFRDARGPLGLTQRQAGGRFTRAEADALIARLEAEVDGPDAPAERLAAAARPSFAERRAAAQLESLRRFSDELLACELQRRGWIVVEP